MSAFSAQELLQRHGIAWIATSRASYTTNCRLGPDISTSTRTRFRRMVLSSLRSRRPRTLEQSRRATKAPKATRSGRSRRSMIITMKAAHCFRFCASSRSTDRKNSPAHRPRSGNMVDQGRVHRAVHAAGIAAEWGKAAQSSSPKARKTFCRSARAAFQRRQIPWARASGAMTSARFLMAPTSSSAATTIGPAAIMS